MDFEGRLVFNCYLRHNSNILDLFFLFEVCSRRINSPSNFLHIYCLEAALTDHVHFDLFLDYATKFKGKICRFVRALLKESRIGRSLHFFVQELRHIDLYLSCLLCALFRKDEYGEDCLRHDIAYLFGFKLFLGDVVDHVAVD